MGATGPKPRKVKGGASPPRRAAAKPGKAAKATKAAKAGKAARAKHSDVPELDEELVEGVEHELSGHLDEDDRTHDVQLTQAFHHLQRAGAVISLLEQDSSGDLRELLKHGIDLYRKASGKKRKKESVKCAFGLLRAAEHLGMAGLYESRSEHRVEVAPPPRSVVAEHLARLAPRLDQMNPQERLHGRRLEAMARDLLRRAEQSSHDPHLEYELTMAAEGICTALEEGL